MASGIISSEKAMCCESAPASVMVELCNRRDRAKAELLRIEDAIALFEKQPELEAALSALGRIGVRL
jgi:hypothetical protein